MAIAGSGLTVTCFAMRVDVWTGYAVMFFCGIFWIWAFNQSWAAMQNIVPDNMRGRVLAIANVAAFGANAVGNVASGWLGEIVADNFPAVAGRWLGADLAKMLGPAMGAHVAVGGFSFALFVAGVVMLMRRVPEVDGLPRVARTAAGRGLVSAVLAREHWPRNGRDQGGRGTGGGGQ